MLLSKFCSIAFFNAANYEFKITVGEKGQVLKHGRSLIPHFLNKVENYRQSLFKLLLKNGPGSLCQCKFRNPAGNCGKSCETDRRSCDGTSKCGGFVYKQLRPYQNIIECTVSYRLRPLQN